MRKYYLDNLRNITVILVVIYHVIYMYNGVLLDGVIGSNHSIVALDSVQYVLYPWFMVILFIIAGMCSRYYLENHTKEQFLKSRTRKLLVPSTLGILAFGWIQGYINLSISHAFEKTPDTVPKFVFLFILPFAGTGVLWFIQVLWVDSLLLFFIRKFEKGKLFEKTKHSGVIAFFICGILYYIAGLILNAPIIAVYRFGIYGYAFFLGYFVLAHDEVIEKLSQYAWLLFSIAVILAGVYLYLHFGDNYAAMPVVGSLSASVYGYVMSLALLGLGKKYLNRTNACTQFLNKRNFALYVFHYPALSAVALLMEKYGNVPQALKYLFILIMAFCGSFLLFEGISRIPLVRFLVLGIKKEKK